MKGGQAGFESGCCYVPVNFLCDLVEGAPPGRDAKFVGVLPEHDLIPCVELFLQFGLRVAGPDCFVVVELGQGEERRFLRRINDG